jgi:hypothetical protein
MSENAHFFLDTENLNSYVDFHYVRQITFVVVNMLGYTLLLCTFMGVCWRHS